MLRGFTEALFCIVKANAGVNFEKCHFCLRELDRIEWLGSLAQENKIRPDCHEIKAILEMPMLNSTKDMA